MANMASACALMGSGGDGKMFFRPTSRWRTREAANTCMLVTISIICVCIMVVCGVLLVREYTLARAYLETTCTVNNVSYTGNELLCTFCSGAKEHITVRPGRYGDRQFLTQKALPSGRHLTIPGSGSGSAAMTIGAACVSSQFPCIRVVVSYEAVDGEHYEALLHPDSLQAAGIYSQCSYDICLRDRAQNWQAVEQYSSRWRTAQRARLSFTCYYNAIEFSDAIVEKVYSESDVIHSMLWPSLVIVLCCAVFLRLETRRRQLTFCGRRTDTASLLLLPSSDVVLETNAQLPVVDDNGSHAPPAPPPTPLLTSQAINDEQPSVSDSAKQPTYFRHVSLPSNFIGNEERSRLTVLGESSETVENSHRITTTMKRAKKLWSSTVSLTEVEKSCSQDQSNRPFPAAIAIFVGCHDDNVNNDISNT